MCAIRRPCETPSERTRAGRSRVLCSVLPVLILVVAVGLPRLLEPVQFSTLMDYGLRHLLHLHPYRRVKPRW